jgi:hypothetical protein
MRTVIELYGCQNDRVPMREECKNFESRTYSDGETVRKCNLDLAPEAPWRCPENCPKFAPRMADVNWSHGTLVTPPTPDEPVGVGVAELLDEAEDIINAVVPEAMADMEARQRAEARGASRWQRWRRRHR